MRQRGRKSAVSLVVANVNGDPPRLLPPPYLNEQEQECFVELVGVCSPRHFVPSDTPLLVSYVQAMLLARGTANDPEKYAIWTSAVRTQAMLATRLRLAPQARSDPKSVARQVPFYGRKPWES